MKFPLSKNIFEYILTTWDKPKGGSDNINTESKYVNKGEVKKEFQELMKKVSSVAKK